MTPIKLGLGIVLIFQGLFLWFALAFNGGVGETFVNFSFFTSALLMIILGVAIIARANKSVVQRLCLASIIFYLPMVWQRFNYKLGLDKNDLLFDALVIGIALCSMMNKPNKSQERTE